MTGAQAEAGVLALLHDLDDLVIDVPLAAGTPYIGPPSSPPI